MTDNTRINTGVSGDLVRDVDKSGVKTQAFVIDIGGSGTEQLLDSTHPLPVTEPDQATTLTVGRKTVTSAGTALVLRATLACKWVSVSALDTNTKLVYVGGSSVLAAAGSQAGIPLAAGQSVTIPVDDATKVYVDSRVSGEGVSFLVGS